MAIGKKGKVHVEDMVFLIRKDPKKCARVKARYIAYCFCFLDFNLSKWLCLAAGQCFEEKN